MKDNVFAIVYGIIGIGIIGLWIMLLATNQVPELETTPAAITFHIVMELLMALMSLLSAWILWKGLQWISLVYVTNGMLIYSVINSSGYYAESGEYAMIVMFALILGYVLYATYDKAIKKEV